MFDTNESSIASASIRINGYMEIVEMRLSKKDVMHLLPRILALVGVLCVSLIGIATYFHPSRWFLAISLRFALNDRLSII